VNLLLPLKKIIYDFALQFGREGAVQELLQNYDKSENLYENGLALMEYLFNEASAAKDKEILQSLIYGFTNRLNQLRAKRFGIQ